MIRSLAATLRGRRNRVEQNRPVASGTTLDAGTAQVLAHTLIADLFGTGLRVQNLMARVPDDLQQELDEIADHIDKVIRELRGFAFGHRE